MEKCGNDSARAGESNASINGPIGLLLTQSLAILFIRAHCIGFFRKLLSHTYPGWDFRSTSSRRWKINKNEEKCGKMYIRIWSMGDGPIGVDFPFWLPFSFSTPTCIIPPTVRYPHHTARPGWGFGNFAKIE